MIEVNDDEDDDEGRFDASLGVVGNSSDDDSDGPVVVDMEDVEASLARSSASHQFPHVSVTSLPFTVTTKYPLLVAAIQPHEDILMTCARALDEKKDVSLVREAAGYLQEIEQRKLSD